MVFQKVFYYPGVFVYGALGVAAPLVASEYVAGLENRAHDPDSCIELGVIPINLGIHSHHNKLLHAP